MRARLRFLAIATTVAALVTTACAPSPTLTPAEEVQRIAAFVESVRGHDFVTEPTVEFLDDTAFEAEVLANLATEEAALAADDTAFTALDWITPSQDLVTEFRKVYGGAVVGFYDPDSEALKVRGTSLTPYRREVIAHELTHALDDQVHDLDDLSGGGLLDEDYLAALVAVEGSAERVRRRYYDALSQLEQFQSIAEQLAAGDDPELLTVPITLLTITQAPYLEGPELMEALVAALGNPAGPDLSLTRYPANTEQGFDAAKYLADEPAQDVPAPATEAGAPVVRTGEFGPLLLSLVLREGLVLNALDPLTAGWAGGSYTTWLDGGASCIRVDTTWDTGADAVAMANALDAWGARHPGAVVELRSPQDVRLTRCD